MKKGPLGSMTSFILIVFFTGVAAIINGADWIGTIIFSVAFTLGYVTGNKIKDRKRRKERRNHGDECLDAENIAGLKQESTDDPSVCTPSQND